MGRHREVARELRRRAELPGVALPVLDRQGMHRPRFPARDRQTRRRVHPPREEDNARSPGSRAGHTGPPTATRSPIATTTESSIARKLVDPLVRKPPVLQGLPQHAVQLASDEPRGGRDPQQGDRRDGRRSEQVEQGRPDPRRRDGADERPRLPEGRDPPVRAGRRTGRRVRMLRAAPARTPNSLANVSAAPNARAAVYSVVAERTGSTAGDTHARRTSAVGTTMCATTFETPRSPCAPFVNVASSLLLEAVPGREDARDHEQHQKSEEREPPDHHDDDPERGRDHPSGAGERSRQDGSRRQTNCQRHAHEGRQKGKDHEVPHRWSGGRIRSFATGPWSPAGEQVGRGLTEGKGGAIRPHAAGVHLEGDFGIVAQRRDQDGQESEALPCLHVEGPVPDDSARRHLQ